MSERLSEILSKMSRVVLDDARAANYEAITAEADALKRRNETADRLDRAGVVLAPAVDAVLRSGGAPNKPTKSLTAAKRWMASDSVPPVLILSGSTGCGKSVAAAWAFTQASHSCIWSTRAAFLQAFVGYFGEAVERQQRMLGCRFLVIDDVGTELDDERMQSALVDMFDARKRSPDRTRTIITTNLNEAQWHARYADPRLASRMRESSAFVTDTGPDLRGAK